MSNLYADHKTHKMQAESRDRTRTNAARQATRDRARARQMKREGR
jgi:hypothetical protein